MTSARAFLAAWPPPATTLWSRAGGAAALDNTLWGGRCILFDNCPRLIVADNPAIENADRITIEAWVNTLSWPARAVVCRKDGSYILYNYSGGFSWYLFGPENRLQ